MFVNTIVTGFVIGLLASIPLGPIGVLCVQRTLSKNHTAGFISGLGATLADVIFAAIAFFSLSMVLSFIESHMTIIKGIGGLCVIGVGINILLTNPVIQIRRNRAGKTNLWQDFLSMFLITLANPAFILVFVALFAAFGMSTSEGNIPGGMAMLVGVMAGSASWWFTLTFVVNLFRRHFRPRHLLWMNRISGTIICVLGALAVLMIFVKTPVDGLFQ